MTEQYEQEKLDHARESHFNREVQHREIQLQNQLQQYRSLMDRDAFILVLIDGDGMIFEDDLISKGEAGGKEAAARLWNSVTEYVRRNMSCIPSDYKIVTRVYANLKGLGEVCRKAGIIDISDVIEEFARGFTGSKQLFDFVDVGVGKDRADDKISEIFKLHLYDSHCRQILFGCSHDNGYARLLEDVAEPTICDSITLLEGVPFEKELAQLDSKYRTAKFEGLFRTKKINVYPPISKHSVPLQTLGSPSPQTNSYRGPQSLQGQSIIQNAISRAKSSTPPTNGSALNPHDASPFVSLGLPANMGYDGEVSANSECFPTADTPANVEVNQ
ncbi:hypothetical protein MMC21_002947 [Puttea exsequens]|nr:hypothetical protein [Puttea exsequens]